MAGTDVTSKQATTVIAKPISGDYRIDVLLEDASYRWNILGELGTAVEVTYSFMSSAPTYAGDDDKKGFTVFNEKQQQAVKQILAEIAQHFGISFRLVDDTASSFGQIRFGNNDQGETSAGYAVMPNSSGKPDDGDVYINNKVAENLDNIVPGTNAYATLVHEIGHAIGLKHPGNYNAGEAASTEKGNYLASSEDSEATTVMSYVKTPQQLERDFYGKYDFLALQYLYGARAFNAGDTVYSFGEGSMDRLQIIDDSGGTDVFDASKSTTVAQIDLRPGGSSSLGKLADGNAALDTITIAYSATIENAIGSRFDDIITGNDAQNRIRGGAGDDTINGGAGIDFALYGGSRSSFQIVADKGSWKVTHADGSEGVDTLTNVERLQFSDGYLAIDMDGSAGRVAKLLGAIFGKSFVANQNYAGIGLRYFDSGFSYEQLTKLAYNVAIGANHTSSQLVDLIARNVYSSVWTETDKASFLSKLDAGTLTQEAFVITAAESSNNAVNIDLVGLNQVGLKYLA